jgi:H+-transporting ATPase
MIGLIPLFDPPREDTYQMLQKTQSKGIRVKMITGDQRSIAKETARQLGLNTNILTGEYIRDKQKLYNSHFVLMSDMIEDAGGFAEVYPQDKYFIIKNLHKQGHTVGMTGDGINDTAALRQSDIGIAVAGSTDAARSAADIVLLNPGLSVIVDAIIGSRKIFQRMKSYCIYSISMAVRTVIVFVILTTVYDWYFPTIGIAILAVLNDGCMISISRDRVTPSEKPDKWNPIRIFTASILYGCYLSISTIVLFELVVHTTFFQDHFGLATLNAEQLVGLIYLQISVAGLATIFITRSNGISWLDRPGLYVLIAYIIAQAIASVIGAYGLGNFNGFGGAGWGYVLVGWVWSLMWYVPLDLLKATVHALENTLLWKEWTEFHQSSIHPYTKKVQKIDYQQIEMKKKKNK